MTRDSLTLTARQIEQLRDHLLREDGLERIAFGYCSRSDDRLLAEEIVPVTDDQLATQSTARCRLKLPVERDLLQNCVNRDMHPLIMHSHPFDTSGISHFSLDDADLMDGLQTMVTGLWPETTIMFAILNTEGITTAVYNPDADQREPLPVTVLGNRRLDTPLTTPSEAEQSEPAATLNTTRYDRGIRAITEHGQRALAETHIGLVGYGGLGSIMATEFARYGSEEFTIVDPDVVEESNLPRLFGAYEHHQGRAKVDVAKEHLWRENPASEVTTVQDTAENAANALNQVDVLVAGVDQVSARMWLNRFAVRHLIPYVDAGVVIETIDTADKMAGDDDAAPPGRVDTMEGYIQLILPGANACFDCLDRGDPEAARIERLSDEEREEELKRGYIDETDLSPEPAVVPLNGIVASKTVQLVAKYVTGYASPADYLRFEGVDNTLTELTTVPSDRCVTCGDSGILGRGDRAPTEADLDETSNNLDLELEQERGSETKPETETWAAVPAAVNKFTALFDLPPD